MPFERDHRLQRFCNRIAFSASEFLCFVLFFTTPIAGAKTHSADSLYQTALARVGSVTLEESLDAFGDVLKLDRDHAPAHYETARLYMSIDTPLGRHRVRASRWMRRCGWFRATGTIN